jgi:hypothetical protein
MQHLLLLAMLDRRLMTKPDISGHHASTRLLEDQFFLLPIGENPQAY